MKKLIFLLFLICLGQNCFSQDFLETKFSINDIKAQRENFVREKIKSVIVKTKYFETVFDIDSEGKIISKNNRGEFQSSVIYKYENNNLVGFLSLDYTIFEYDKKGNIKKMILAGGSVEGGDEGETVSEYIYDSQNKLIKEIVHSEFESCPFQKIVYKGLLMIEKIYPCCEGFYANRTVFEYNSNNNLSKIISYSKRCLDNSGVESSSQEEYYYEGNSLFPFKIVNTMENGNEETILSYEYF